MIEIRLTINVEVDDNEPVMNVYELGKDNGR